MDTLVSTHFEIFSSQFRMWSDTKICPTNIQRNVTIEKIVQVIVPTWLANGSMSRNKR